MLVVIAAVVLLSGNRPAPQPPADLTADFSELQDRLDAEIGIAITPVGGGQPVLTLGTWQNGPAWSTIKVPLVIAALREQDSPNVTDDMVAAITKSDNAAAESIWQSLGEPQTAAHKVEAVLAETGDHTVVEWRKVRAEFSAFGQTIWSSANQMHFLSAAACDSRNAPVLSLMGQVEADQRWGLGVIPDTRFKGGWGPSLDGKYLVRQIGLINTPTGVSSVAVAAEPKSGSLTDGTGDLTEIANWLTAHKAVLPAGHCDR
jgi:hypothetical protein